MRVLVRRSTSGRVAVRVAVVAARALRVVGRRHRRVATEQRPGGAGFPRGIPGDGPRDVIRSRGRRRGGRRAEVAAVGQAVLALPLHAAVLEPDLDLALGEAERVRDLDAPAPGQVAVEVELFLELERLVARVGGARALRVVVGGRRRARTVQC